MSNTDQKNQPSVDQLLQEATQSKARFATQADKITQLIDLTEKAVRAGGTIFACGNGGSACDAMHFVEECVARYSKERPGIKAMHLGDPGIVSCWANDYSFDGIFERQIQTFAGENDILFAFSTSGNSENILRALKAANEKGCHSVAMLGKQGGAAKSMARTSLIVDSDNTARIQEAHITAVHVIVEILENRLF